MENRSRVARTVRSSSCFIALLALLMPCACGSDSEDGNTGTGGTSGTGGSPGSGGSVPGDGGAGEGLDCATACAKAIAAQCESGPPNEALCSAVCDGLLTGTNQQCKDAMQGVLDCMSPSSTVTCTSDGALTSSDCGPEWAALVPCLPMI